MEKPTGIFFSNQKVQDLVDAVSSFEEISQDITAKTAERMLKNLQSPYSEKDSQTS